MYVNAIYLEKDQTKGLNLLPSAQVQPGLRAVALSLVAQQGTARKSLNAVMMAHGTVRKSKRTVRMALGTARMTQGTIRMAQGTASATADVVMMAVGLSVMVVEDVVKCGTHVADCTSIKPVS